MNSCRGIKHTVEAKPHCQPDGSTFHLMPIASTQATIRNIEMLLNFRYAVSFILTNHKFLSTKHRLKKIFQSHKTSPVFIKSINFWYIFYDFYNNANKKCIRYNLFWFLKDTSWCFVTRHDVDRWIDRRTTSKKVNTITSFFTIGQFQILRQR